MRNSKVWPFNRDVVPARAGSGPRISIVVPSYNQGRFLEECLASIVNQDYADKELIVMDGGSSDESLDVIRHFEESIDFWRSERDGGQGAAINSGMARSTGEILCWINSDDMLMPGALTRVADQFRNPAIDVVYGDALNLFEESNEIQYWQAHWIHNAFLDIGGLVSSHSIFWRRAIHKPIWEELKCNIDGELWQRLLPSRRLRYLPLPLGIYRAHQETKSSAEAWASAWAADDTKVWARHGAPRRGRLKMQFFSKSQRIFKLLQWTRMRGTKREIVASMGWSDRTWRGPAP